MRLVNPNLDYLVRENWRDDKATLGTGEGCARPLPIPVSKVVLSSPSPNNPSWRLDDGTWRRNYFSAKHRGTVNGLNFICLHLRNRKHVPCFYRVIETRVEVWENEKCCGNTSRRRVFPQLSSSAKLSRVFL